MKNVLVIGSACADVVIRLDHLPKTEEDIHPKSQSFSLGGCAYNVANILRQSGSSFTFLTPVGTGIFGDFVRNALSEKGFPPPIRVTDQENGCCYCLVEESGERTFLSCHGAEYTFQKAWAEPIRDRFFDMVYVCGLEVEEPTGEELVSWLEERIKQFPETELFFAPGPRIMTIPPERFARITALRPILHINENEAFLRTGCHTFEEAARLLSAITKNTVIITLGDRGAYCLMADGSCCHVPAVKTTVKNTIGAGDSHIGAVLAGLSHGMDMRESLAAASHISSAVVNSDSSGLTDDEFQLFVDQFFHTSVNP
ncbi:PfkB family carbohydrate kinase [Clostridium sp. AM58-1XD]|uniref:PfkB family carbohydrate kinase n=1 Tax=Clostridium sp. AM58-1XD TaxID=2292307 RepID=UPI000E52222B|nr:PfkB family carbohydrate kinase [Clostridium sp. AM58-1XD]RGZ01864.1 carbohydrate kinase family protein [Clostridium sp. AM58-1XD]